MKNLKGIRTKLLLIIALALILPSSLLGILTYQQTEVINYSSVIGSKEELESISSSFSKIFEEAAKTMTTITALPEVQHQSFAFRNSVTRDTSNLPPANEPVKTEFYDELFAQYTDSPYIMNVYIGTSEGALYLSPLPPSSVNLNEFDPRSRDWYELAMASPDQIVWTEPYIDVASGESTMALAKTLHDGSGNIIGVVGIDFELNQLALMMRENIKWNTLYITLAFFLIGMTFVFLFVRSFTNRIFAVRDAMKTIEKGDFTQRIDVKGTDEIADLSQSFNQMAGATQSLLAQVQGSTHDVTVAANDVVKQTETYKTYTEEITKAIEEIASGATDQAQTAEDNSHLIHELAQMVKQLQADSQSAYVSANQSQELSAEGSKKLATLEVLSGEATNKNDDTAKTIQNLIEKSTQVGEITKIITGLSDQTNLLALNAAIEAARAGEHGRGFAVVADEVRKLAEESGKSASNIESIIEDIQNEIKKTIHSMDEMKGIVQEQNKAVNATKLSFGEISNAVTQTTDRIQRISEFIEQVNEKKNGMMEAIQNMSAISEETAAGAEQVSATTDEQRALINHFLELANQLGSTANQLEDEMKRFML